MFPSFGATFGDSLKGGEGDFDLRPSSLKESKTSEASEESNNPTESNRVLFSVASLGNSKS